MKHVVREFPEDVNYGEIDADNRENFEDWGAWDQIFIDEKPLRAEPPRSRKTLRKLVSRRVRAFPRRG